MAVSPSWIHTYPVSLSAGTVGTAAEQREGQVGGEKPRHLLMEVPKTHAS